ncbi:cysteine dioxygenase family protein [bacterium]|nr:cysteine dioxygenase family protein [bacterium]
MVRSEAVVRQEWWDVLRPPADLAQQCGQLVSQQQAEGPLDQQKLSQLVRSIADKPELWKPLVVVDPSRRRYRLIYEDDRIDVWVLSWMPGQGTGFHDHDHSEVALMCVQGTILEKQMMLPTGASRIEMTPGYVRTGGAGYIHAVSHIEGEPAVSLHAYSPPLIHVGQYVVDGNGILERQIEHGRRELMDHTIESIVGE